MNTRTPLSRLCGAALAAAALPFSVSAPAQQPAIEEVVVTGSRIARDANLTGPLPVQSLNAEDIRASGEFTLADIVNDVPSLLTSTTSEQSGANTNTLSLRGLGSARTLTLVDGRRHVGGLQGSSAVDTSSIPAALVERVEVLTGGASAVYGADAVTGVVNFILRDDYEGLEIDARYGMSEYGDAEQSVLSVVYGENFDNGRGNVAFAIDVRQDNGLRVHERADGLEISSAGNYPNPALRFQRGDIGDSTPNFARYYNYDNTGQFNIGLSIPQTEQEFIDTFTEEFGEAPSLTSAETALINQAANATPRAIHPLATFSITSGYGYVIPGNPFAFSGFDAAVPIDVDGNGNPDCLDSFTGYNSSLTGASAFGVAGGCWNINEDGSYNPVRDVLVAQNFNGFGGDSYNTIRQRDDWLTTPDEKVTLNLMAHYDISDTATAFGEFKYVTSETESDGRPNSFWDLLLGAPDNPYIPDFLQGVADEHGGIAITIDPIGFDAYTVTEREVLRSAVGIEGELDNGWNWEVSANYGRFDRLNTRPGRLIVDRFFAAIDAVVDPATGQPACRADVDPEAPATNTPFGIPAYEEGYFSFTPGGGACRPLNIWAGKGGMDQAAVDWVTTTLVSELTIDQTVFSASLVGDLGDWFELPGGAPGFAVGAEYREEMSDAKFDSWERGVIPPGAPFPAGSQVSDHSENSSLTFRPQLSTRDERGEYDATDGFVELSLPLLADQPLFSELTLDMAGRWSDYSTIGATESWKVNLLWAPFEDLALRGGLSQAVRAPNITELFGPETGTTFRPDDPCAAEFIEGIATEDPQRAQNIENNCAAEFQSFGLDPYDASGAYVYVDPLSASFGGITGGNRDLLEETADTLTYGFVYQPSFLPGLSLTADYWDIEIEDAIQAVSSQDIVEGCYIGSIPNPSFCDLFTRNTDSNSAQFGGFNFIRSTAINFAKLATDGVDMSVRYAFDIGEHGFDVSVSGTRVYALDNFTNPLDPDEVDVELTEIERPELAGNVHLSWTWGGLNVRWQSQYLGEMLLGSIEVDTVESLYGDSALVDPIWIHDLNASYEVDERLSVYGGVNNLAQEKPVITSFGIPVGPRGRMIFLGGTYRL